MIQKIKENWFLILLVSISALWLWANIYLQKEVSKTTDLYKSKLGTEFVLGKDTLTIIDYNSFTEVFILSNKQEINKNLVK